MSKRKASAATPVTKKAKGEEKEGLEYMCGFGNEFESEAMEGALPITTTPQVCPLGLYAEQLSGTAFTAPRDQNQRSWLYRTKPAAQQSRYTPYAKATLISGDFSQAIVNPERTRWRAFPLPDKDSKTDFVDGMKTVCGAGSPDMKTGIAIHVYAANTSMGDRGFSNADGDLLVVPEMGSVRVRTEFGNMDVRPGEIFIIPRGILFSVDLKEASSIRGYILEIYSGHFKLPDLGPIGSNGLANARDFQIPVAAFEDRDCDFEIVYKFVGKLFTGGHKTARRA